MIPALNLKTLNSALNYLSNDSSSLVSSTAGKLLAAITPKKLSEEPVFEYKTNIPYGISAKKTITAPSSVFIQSSTNGLVFNFIDPEVLNDIEDESN